MRGPDNPLFPTAQLLRQFGPRQRMSLRVSPGLLDDTAERSVKVYDRGLARLIECADRALAALLANNSRIRKYCMRAGDRHLAVPASFETAFKRTVKEAGYLVQAGETAGRTRSPQRRRANPPDVERGENGQPPIRERGEADVLSESRTMDPTPAVPRIVEAQAGD
jgi:hypothetical protein